MYILTEQTPNPLALKFIPHCMLATGLPQAFRRETFQAGLSPLAVRFFELPEVAGVFIARDFVTVTLKPNAPPWSAVRLQAISALANHLAAGAPAVAGSPPPTVIKSEIEDEIRGVLALYVSPGVARDGGDVVFDQFNPDTGVLWVEMRGACGGCPSSQLTLKATIENIVRHYVPEVLRVEATASANAEGAPNRLKAWVAKLKGVKSPGTRPIFTHNGEPAAPR